MSALKQVSKEHQNVSRGDMLDVLRSYNLEEARIGMIASHSALDLAEGAKEENFQTVAVCQRGRERTYLRYKRIITRTLILESFSQILQKDIQKKLMELNVLLVPNRSLTTYVKLERIERELLVPMFGNRSMLKTDERELQHELLEEAGIQQPQKFKSYKNIDRLCMVKAKEPIEKIERAFFTCASPKEFMKKWKSTFANSPAVLEEQLKTGKIWIEEFALGALFNFNYFYSPLKKELEFLGIDRRIQTNLDGILKLPAEAQIGKNLNIKYYEIGHESATIRESMLEKVYELGEKFVVASKRMYPPGIIGPFALQGAVTPNLQIVIYDVSPRMPGSPVLYSSPYSQYYFGFPVTSGRRVAMEIKGAIDTEELEKIIA